MPNLSNLTEYKNRFMEFLINNKQICSLLTDTDGESIPYDNLKYTQIFPYDFIPDTIDEQKTFICFDVDIPRVKTLAVTDVYLYVYVFTHKDLMRIPQKGIRPDLICHVIDTAINGDTTWGFEKLELESCTRMSPPGHDMRGRVLRYRVEDWNRFGDKL